MLENLTTGSIELINLTGVASTSSVGSILPSRCGIGLTGLSSTSAVGSITPADVIQGLTLDQSLHLL